MLGLSKQGMFLYDLQQKVMFDADQIVVMFGLNFISLHGQKLCLG